MNLRTLFIFSFLTASAISHRKRDDERHGRRVQLKHQDNALAELETKLAEDGFNIEPLPEDANDNLNWGRHHHQGWRRRGCKDNNERQVETGNLENEQNDVKCERHRLRGWYRHENKDNNEKEGNQNNHENYRSLGWYRRAHKPESDDGVNNQNENEENNSRIRHYGLRRREYKNQNEHSDNLPIDQDKNNDKNVERKSEGHHDRSWYHRIHPSGHKEENSNSKWQKLYNFSVINRESGLWRRGHHHRHHHRDQLTTTTSTSI